MDSFLKDLKHSLRMFLQAPGFTIAALTALTLGIATNAAIFSVVNTVLLKPFAYRDPGRIVMFEHTFQKTFRTGTASPAEFNWWRQQTQAFQDVSAYTFDVANLTGDSLPEQIQVTRVSASFFHLCGANALYGRTFSSDDDVPNAPKSVVLSYSFWQQRFAGDARVIGRRITLSGEPHEIIGVAGPDLINGQIAEQSLGSGDIAVNAPPDVYLPFQLDPNSVQLGHYFNVAGRLKPGVAWAEANAQLQAGYPEYARKTGDFAEGMSFGVQPLQDVIVGGIRKSLFILLGAVSFVLLIACANVANLLLARATGRRREIAIRAAVGAGRGRIVRQLLTESMLLSLTGGALGVAAGFAGIRAILRVVPGGIPRIGAGGSNVSMDWRVLGFSVALSILTGLLFGLIPALQASRADLNRALKESGNRNGTGMQVNKTRSLLVAIETGLAVVLLIGSALLIRTFFKIRYVDPGFDAHNVLTMRMSLEDPQFEKLAGVTRVIHETLRRVNALPGVEVAAATCCVPLEDRFRLTFQIAGRPEGRNAPAVAGFAIVSPGYFETFKIPLVQGRSFLQHDDDGPPIVIINQTMAKQFWPRADPLKDQIVIGHEAPRQIIGVVGDVRDDALNRNPRPILYELSAQMTSTGLMTTAPWAWVIRTRVSPLTLSSAIQKELRDASGGLPVASVRTMEETLSRSAAAQNFNALVLTIFGCAALLLASIGIYGLMAYSVAQRTQEIGIRLALGAGSSRIRNMVVLQGLRPALAGVACGLAAAFGLTRLIANLLFGVKAWDPLVFFAVPLILAGVALLAVWLPARRASRVEPIHALRYE
jgi:putative ABC transport system permease protein